MSPAWLTRLRHWLGPRRRSNRPRIVRRVALPCPHDCALVEADILQGEEGGSRPVLRCSARPECPPICDHACRHLHAAIAGPARALLILPPGDDPPDEID
jgi:hypothetical protein